MKKIPVKELLLDLKQAKSLDPELRKKGYPLEFLYGQNPGEAAIPYREKNHSGGVLDWKYLGGAKPSYNKLIEAAKIHKLLQITEAFDDIPTAITGKHGEISGFGASYRGIEVAYKIAHNCDPEADVGNCTMVNKECTTTLAKMVGKDWKNKWGMDLALINGTIDNTKSTVYTESFGSPSIPHEPREILLEKQKKTPTLFETSPYSNFPYKISEEDGCFFCREKTDYNKRTPRKGRWVTRRKGNEEIEDQLFATVEGVKVINSNGIWVGYAITEDGVLKEMGSYGVGTSTKRSRAVKIACETAGPRAKGALMASDGFFYDKDNIRIAAEYEIDYIIVPEGGYKKEKVIEEADRHGIGMYFLDTSIRLFSHSH